MDQLSDNEQFDDDDEQECPLCCAPYELDDQSFMPCNCQYKICRFCWHRIRTNENGLCPACREPYSEQPTNYNPLTSEQLLKFKNEKRMKEQQKKQKISESRKHLSKLRVVQKNLVFVVGLSTRLADAEMLKRNEYFGKFGKILKIMVNSQSTYVGSQFQGPSASAYVTFHRSEDALKAIQSVNNLQLDNRLIKASLGTTKYCSCFLKNQPCSKPDCMYLHDIGDDAASFTKEEMQQGKHTEYEKKLIDLILNSSGRAQTKSPSNISSGGNNKPPKLLSDQVTDGCIDYTGDQVGDAGGGQQGGDSTSATTTTTSTKKKHQRGRRGAKKQQQSSDQQQHSKSCSPSSTGDKNRSRNNGTHKQSGGRRSERKSGIAEQQHPPVPVPTDPVPMSSNLHSGGSNNSSTSTSLSNGAIDSTSMQQHQQQALPIVPPPPQRQSLFANLITAIPMQSSDGSGKTFELVSENNVRNSSILLTGSTGTTGYGSSGTSSGVAAMSNGGNDHVDHGGMTFGSKSPVEPPGVFSSSPNMTSSTSTTTQPQQDNDDWMNMFGLKRQDDQQRHQLLSSQQQSLGLFDFLPPHKSDDDLGFDPFSESVKGLADLLVQEQQEEHFNHQQRNVAHNQQQQQHQQNNRIDHFQQGMRAVYDRRNIFESQQQHYESNTQQQHLYHPQQQTTARNSYHQDTINLSQQQQHYQWQDHSQDPHSPFNGPPPALPGMHRNASFPMGQGGMSQNTNIGMRPPKNFGQAFPPIMSGNGSSNGARTSTPTGGGGQQQSFTPSFAHAPPMGMPSPNNGGEHHFKDFEQALRQILPNVNIKFAAQQQQQHDLTSTHHHHQQQQQSSPMGFAPPPNIQPPSLPPSFACTPPGLPPNFTMPAPVRTSVPPPSSAPPPPAHMQLQCSKMTQWFNHIIPPNNATTTSPPLQQQQPHHRMTSQNGQLPPSATNPAAGNGAAAIGNFHMPPPPPHLSLEETPSESPGWFNSFNAPPPTQGFC